MEIDWTKQLDDQLDWHWEKQLRPKLDGLTDDEYFWEPAENSWTVHRDGTVDFADPEPDPAPVTTIAWRLAHIIVGVFGVTAAEHFGGPPTDYASHPYATTADEALRQLDKAYEVWRDGVRGLDAEKLTKPSGPAEGPYADRPVAALILHINREAIHHGAEILLLRDLYRNKATLG